ncbi:STAS domain-containing protein [Acidisphaera sp. S103]|uniref:STAS domain-containing protein n=1 Tax=Acidisphaera sp. S103 TaxID=1747223 RepID=UPI00131BFB82|nr:STAS domain-containing protein [Acidisphaera sp. S103]
MARPKTSRLPAIILDSTKYVLADWLARVIATADKRIPRAELEEQCESIVAALVAACHEGDLTDINDPSLTALREIVVDLSLSRGLQGFSAMETATFVLSLKAPLFACLRMALTSEPEHLVAETLTISELIDALALFMMESFQRTREELISRQRSEMTESPSAPVMRMWQGIVALPLVGALDADRTQAAMEHLLDCIMQYEAEFAIIDISEVPVIEDRVFQQMLKTVAAIRLMGADCIISGIRPHIAQTMVHLGVELNVVSKSNLADAFALALRRMGRMVVKQTRSETAA